MKNLMKLLLLTILFAACGDAPSSKTPLGVIQPTTGSKWYWQYPDTDKDGFGDNTRPDSLYKKKAIMGYVSLKGDCDDTRFNVNPSMPEIMDGLDNNCNGLIDDGIAELFLTTSNVLVPEFMGTGGTTDMFVPKENDPNSTAFIAQMAKGNFTAFIHSEGQLSSYVRWKEPFGSKGVGYNAIKPTDCKPFNGALCDNFCSLFDGTLCKPHSRDFNLSWLDLCQNLNAKAVYTHNIQSGTLAELYYVIERFPEQKVFPIIYGMEGATNNYPIITDKTYPAEFYRLVDSVENKFPTRKFKHIADLNKSNSKWVQSFINYKPIDSNLVAVCKYFHGAHQYGNLTGVASQDLVLYLAGVSTLQKNIEEAESLFPGCEIYDAQSSSGIPGYMAAKVNGRIVDMFWYFIAEKMMMDRTRMGQSKFIGSNIIGLKLMLKDLDFKWFAIKNTFYKKPYTLLSVSQLTTETDIVAGVYQNEYCILIQNRSSKSVPLPKYIQIDNKVIQPAYEVTSTGYYGTSLESTTAEAYYPTTTGFIQPLSFTYLTFKTQ